jgi:hypothetical protein
MWLNSFPYRLNDLIDANSPGWDLQEAAVVANSGQVLGTGTRFGQTLAYIATPYIPGGQGALTVNCSVVASNLVATAPLPTVHFEVSRPLTGQSLGSFDVAPDVDGLYHLDLNVRGLLSIRASSSHWLAKRLNDVVVSDVGTVGGDFILVNGDLTGDNRVDAVDEAAMYELLGYYDIALDSEQWANNADLDGDGWVTLADLQIIQDNMGSVGDS